MITTDDFEFLLMFGGSSDGDLVVIPANVPKSSVLNELVYGRLGKQGQYNFAALEQRHNRIPTKELTTTRIVFNNLDEPLDFVLVFTYSDDIDVRWHVEKYFDNCGVIYNIRYKRGHKRDSDS